MRHQLKPKTPSARARMSYILRADRYGVNQARAAELVAAGVANLPTWADGPAAFWSAVDGFERANGRLCLELELNLPRELSRDGQVAAIASYIDRLTAEAGRFPITWAVHDSGDGNPHVHLMLQERPLDGRELSGPKAHFHRADKKRPERSGVAKSRWWHDREHVFWSRALWADACNQALLREGHVARFDARRKSVRLDEALRAGDLRKAAALCTQTERHEGVKVAAARRKLEGGWIEADDLPEQVMQIISANDCARGYNGWLRDWARTASEKELQLFLADHLHDLHQTLAVEMQGTHIEARAAWLEQQHAEALTEDSERTAELAELVAGEGEQQAADLGHLGAVQAAHAEALAEDSQRTAELSELVASEADRQAADLGHLGAVQAAHAEALAEDAQRTAAELERMHDRLRHQLRCALAEGALDHAGGQAVLDRLVGADANRIRGAVVDVAELRAELAELVAAETERQAVELGQLAAVQADDLVGQYNRRLARLGLHQLPELDLDDPATLIHHDDERQWLEFEGQDGDVLGCWADDPDTQWRYDAEADDWVEHDPDHRPSSGPRMG